MRTLDVTVKTLREIVRQPRNLALSLGLPVAFMLIFGLAFGHDDDRGPSTVAVLDLDGGDAGRAFADGLRDAKHPDGAPLFAVTVVLDASEARRGVEDRTYDAFVTLPESFTSDLTPGEAPVPGATPLAQGGSRPTPPKGATVEVVGDPSSPGFAAALPSLQAFAQGFAEQASGQPPLVAFATTDVASRELTRFDVIAPGLMVFAVLNLVPQAGSVLARETEFRTLDRIRASPLGATRLLGGVALAELLVASVALLLMLATAWAMGFHNQGSYTSAFAIAFGAAVAVIGIGLLVASFATTQSEAQNLGILVAVPGSFLSGSFFAVPGVRLFDAGGRSWELYDLLPTTHAVEAMRAVMAFGRPLAEVADLLAIMLALAALYFAAGVVLFRRARLAPQ